MSSMATMNFDVFLRILTEFVTTLLTCDEASFQQQLSHFKVCSSFTELLLHYALIMLILTTGIMREQ